MTTIVDIDGKSVTVIETFNDDAEGWYAEGWHYIYILSDFIHFSEIITGRYIWTSIELSEGTFHVACDSAYNYVLNTISTRTVNSITITQTDHVCEVMMLNSSATLDKVYDLTIRNIELANQIKELKADLELYKSTKEFIEECKSMN